MAGFSVIYGWSFCHIWLVFLSYMAGLSVIYGWSFCYIWLVFVSYMAGLCVIYGWSLCHIWLIFVCIIYGHICFVIEVELTHCFIHLHLCLLYASKFMAWESWCFLKLVESLLNLLVVQLIRGSWSVCLEFRQLNTALVVS